MNNFTATVIKTKYNIDLLWTTLIAERRNKSQNLQWLSTMLSMMVKSSILPLQTLITEKNFTIENDLPVLQDS